MEMVARQTRTRNTRGQRPRSTLQKRKKPRKSASAPMMPPSTRFLPRDDTPVPLQQTSCKFALQTLNTLTESEREVFVENWAREEYGRSFARSQTQTAGRRPQPAPPEPVGYRRMNEGPIAAQSSGLGGA